MKIIKIIGGSLAALWGLGILLKMLRTLPFIFASEFGVSRLLGGLAGLLIAGLISYACFKGAFKGEQVAPTSVDDGPKPPLSRP